MRLDPKEIDLIAKWLNNPKNFLVVIGSPGAGKTYLCAAIFDWMMDKTNSIRYWNERQLLRALRDGIDSGHGDYLKDLKLKSDDEFFILDDIGSSGAPSEWRKEVLFDLLDMRYESMLPSVFTSNLTRAELGNDYGKRFASRLCARENTIIELHDATDLRSVDLNERK